MSSKLVNAIRSAVGEIQNDRVFIFTGKVVDISDASVDGTIQVQQINGKVASSILQKDPEYSFNQQGANVDYQTNLINQQAGPLVFTVDLQPSPGGFFYVVPTINSYVTVAYSTFQNPFVISFQDASYMVQQVGDNTQLMISDGTYQIDNGDTVYLQSNQQFTIKNADTSIVDLLQQILYALTDISQTTIPSSGGTIGIITPDLPAQINNLTNSINSLFV